MCVCGDGGNVLSRECLYVCVFQPVCVLTCLLQIIPRMVIWKLHLQVDTKACGHEHNENCTNTKFLLRLHESSTLDRITQEELRVQQKKWETLCNELSLKSRFLSSFVQKKSSYVEIIASQAVYASQEKILNR